MPLTEELRDLSPTNSASQIAERLHRQRSAICRKAERLRQEGLLSHNPPQRFDVNPPKRRPPAGRHNAVTAPRKLRTGRNTDRRQR